MKISTEFNGPAIDRRVLSVYIYKSELCKELYKEHSKFFDTRFFSFVSKNIIIYETYDGVYRCVINTCRRRVIKGWRGGEGRNCARTWLKL